MPKLISPTARQRIISEFERGASPAILAKEAGVNTSSVYRILREKRESDETARCFVVEVNWRQQALQSLRMLCLREPIKHGIQKVSKFGQKFYSLSCGCQRRKVEPVTIYSRSHHKATIAVEDNEI